MGVAVGDKLKELIRLNWEIDTPVCMIGGFGIGKTQIAREITEDLTKDEGIEYKLINLKLAGYLPDQVKGIMYFDQETKTTTFLKPEFIEDRPCVLFLDEITNVPYQTVTTLLELVNERRIGKYELHPKTKILAAGNPPSESQLAYRIVEALKTRFLVVDVYPDKDAFTTYALRNNFTPEIISFINAFPNELYVYRNEDINMPCPRQYESVDRFIKAFTRREKVDWVSHWLNPKSPYFEIIDSCIVGRIGKVAAATFKTFLKTASLIDINKVLTGDVSELKNIKKLNEADRQAIEYFIATSIAFRVSDNKDMPLYYRVIEALENPNAKLLSIIILRDSGTLEKVGLLQKFGSTYVIPVNKDTEIFRKFLKDSNLKDIFKIRSEVESKLR